MIIKITAEVDIDVSDLSPEFVDIEGFAIEEARRIMIQEPEFYEFEYEIKEKGETK